MENMKTNDDIFKDFQKSLEGLKGNLHVLETDISVEKQMEYFRYSENVRKNRENETVEEQIEILNSFDDFDEITKYAMTFLAISGDVKAYRALETYNENHKDDLNYWAALSLMQAKIILETEFSDEKQIFISTGLGGKGNKLRFYAFFKSANASDFSDYQRKLIETEFPFFINKYHGELEQIKIENNYFSLLFLNDLTIDIKKMLLEAMEECNQYGDFISVQFIITNVKTFEKEDIEKELHRD